jgi:hypothetical protein
MTRKLITFLHDLQKQSSTGRQHGRDLCKRAKQKVQAVACTLVTINVSTSFVLEGCGEDYQAAVKCRHYDDAAG